MFEPDTEHKKCVHHWMIDAAYGPTSFGVCKHCGLVKEFSNMFEEPFIKHEIASKVAKPGMRSNIFI